MPSPVLQVPAHHVMAEQGAGPPAAQRGLPALGGHQGHVEAVLRAGRPRQELLQGRQVKADGRGGVLVIVPDWPEEEAAGTRGLLMREPEAGVGSHRKPQRELRDSRERAPQASYLAKGPGRNGPRPERLPPLAPPRF